MIQKNKEQIVKSVINRCVNISGIISSISNTSKSALSAFINSSGSREF